MDLSDNIECDEVPPDKCLFIKAAAVGEAVIIFMIRLTAAKDHKRLPINQMSLASQSRIYFLLREKYCPTAASVAAGHFMMCGLNVTRGYISLPPIPNDKNAIKL